MKARLNHLRKQSCLILGLKATQTSLAEKLLSGIGAILGIFITQWISLQYFDLNASLFFVGSMAATSVLIFALPHAPLSQPWNIFAGHIFAAIIGIACQQYIADPLIASAVAVGLAISCMHFTHSLHPPAGATALFCVMGGAQVYQLGYHFIYAPLLVNLICLVGIALVFNCCFHWRRYPAHFNRQAKQTEQPQTVKLSQEDFSAAFSGEARFADISSEEIVNIVNTAIANAQQHQRPQKLILEPGESYSNAELGRNWSIRRIISIDKRKIKYKTIAGDNAGKYAASSISEFRRWAKHPVKAVNQHWVKQTPNNQVES